MTPGEGLAGPIFHPKSSLFCPIKPRVHYPWRLRTVSPALCVLIEEQSAAGEAVLLSSIFHVASINPVLKHMPLIKPFKNEFLLKHMSPLSHCLAFLSYSWCDARDPSRACFIAGMQSEWRPNLRDQLPRFSRATLPPTPRWECLSFAANATFTLFIWQSDVPGGPLTHAVGVGYSNCLGPLGLPFLSIDNLKSYTSIWKLRIRRAPHWENSGSTWNHLFLENVKFMYNVTGSPTIVSSYHGRMPKGVVVTMSSKAIFWRLCPCEASPPSGR